MKSPKNNNTNHTRIWNHKTGDRHIVTKNPVCRGCSKIFKQGDIAYLGDVNKILSCRSCLGQGSVQEGDGKTSPINDIENETYLYGLIKIEEIETK